jgi:ParB-like chromosome segregation protein Spo0J
MNIDIEIEKCPVDRLSPLAGNPRTHSDQQVEQVAASIREFGWTNPILVGADGEVIAGHARLKAAIKLGMPKVPVIRFQHLSEKQRRALVIADNQLALNAGWDEDLLQIELILLRNADYDLGLVGFEDEELARLLAGQDATDALTDEDAVPELPEHRFLRRATYGFSVITACFAATPPASPMSSASSAPNQQTWSSPIRPTTLTMKATRRIALRSRAIA